MQENVGGMDRALRAMAGPLLMGLGYSRRDEPTGIIMLATGAILAGTALTRKCPMNAMLGVDTAHAGEWREASEWEVHGAAARPDMERTEGMPRAAEFGRRPDGLTPAPD